MRSLRSFAAILLRLLRDGLAARKGVVWHRRP